MDHQVPAGRLDEQILGLSPGIHLRCVPGEHVLCEHLARQGLQTLQGAYPSSLAAWTVSSFRTFDFLMVRQEALW